MSYTVSLTKTAEDDLARLGDARLQSFVLEQLEHLARAPAALGHPASFPHLPYQKHQFWNTDHTIHFTVLFQYSQDETALIVVAVGVVRY